MNQNECAEDVELERMMQNMSVDDFVDMMLELSKQENEEEDQFYTCDPMDEAQNVFRLEA